MRRLFAFPLALIVLALAAAPARADDVLDASRKEKARREALNKNNKSKKGKSDKEATQVLSNTGLKKAGANAKFSQVGGSASAEKDAKDGTAATTTPGADGAKAAAKGSNADDKGAADEKAEAQWRERLSGAEGRVSSARKDLEELNQKINELRRMSSTADDPHIRLRVSDELRQAESQIPAAQQAIRDAEKGVADVREEARREGVPSGWLR